MAETVSNGIEHQLVFSEDAPNVRSKTYKWLTKQFKLLTQDLELLDLLMLGKFNASEFYAEAQASYRVRRNAAGRVVWDYDGSNTREVVTGLRSSIGKIVNGMASRGDYAAVNLYLDIPKSAIPMESRIDDFFMWLGTAISR